MEMKDLKTITKFRMSQNCFQVWECFYEQKEGSEMGDLLSPFLANLLGGGFTSEPKNNFQYCPRVWFRYVADIFAVFGTNKCNVKELTKTCHKFWQITSLENSRYLTELLGVNASGNIFMSVFQVFTSFQFFWMSLFRSSHLNLTSDMLVEI